MAVKNFNKLYTLWKIIKNGELYYNKDNKLKVSELICDWNCLSYVINNKAAKKLTSKLYYHKKYVLDSCIIHHVADFLIYTLLQTYTYKYPLFCVKKKDISYIREKLSKKTLLFLKKKRKEQEEKLKLHKLKSIKSYEK